MRCAERFRQRTIARAPTAVIAAFALSSAVLALACGGIDEQAASGENDLRARELRELARAQIDSIEDSVMQSVSSRRMPGAAFAVGHRDRVLRLGGYGRLGWADNDPPVVADQTIYDLASLTKAIATTTAVLLLVQDGRIDLDQPVQRWVPDLEGEYKDRITWRHLLTHTSGLPPAGRMRGDTPAGRVRSLLRTRLAVPPGREVMYSDIGFIAVWEAARRVAGEPLPRLLERRVFGPLGMHDTSFWPDMDCERCAPTMWLGRANRPFRGLPADSIARALGVPNGSAGLFSTAPDLARFAAMIANGGTLEGVAVLRPELVRELFRQQPGAGRRTLGWEAFCPDETLRPRQPCAAPIAFGHTGWTGTSIHVDTMRGSWVVLLSNRSLMRRAPPPLDTLRRAIVLGAARAAEALEREAAICQESAGAC